MDTKLRKTLSAVLGVCEDDITRETSASSETRWDSLRHINLIFALEEAFEVRFSDEEIPALTNVRAIEEALAKRA
jgi:acyl carrier protein